MLNSPTDASSMTAVPLPGSAFAVLGLSLSLVRALTDEGYAQPTPVQSRAIPSLLDGRDLLACAQTGTGKTAAFLLPVLQRLAERAPSDRRRVRALVLSPTRELAAQISERATAYGKHTGLRHTVIYGGVSQRAQEAALRRGCDLVIATPGRLIDLIGQRVVSLEDVEIVVLDEADRMLDMGFVNDVRRIFSRMPSRKQTLLFSATMPSDIRHLANELLRSPVTIAVTPEVTAAPTVTHAVWHVSQHEKRPLMLRVLSEDKRARRAIVFTRTKHRANRVFDQLVQAGLSAGVIHGNKSQNARERVLQSFRVGSTRVLVATDIAARGIDVDDVGLVVNYDLPDVAESYVHRIGRTGRAGNDGDAVSFCDELEGTLLRDIEKLLQFRIPVAGAVGVEPPRPQPVAPLFPGDSNRRRRTRFRR